MPAGFTGRAKELRSLTGFVQRAGEARAPAVALVRGQPGHGKTRLLAEVCAQLPGPNRVRLSGHQPESSIPLAAARDLLRLLSDGPEGALVDRLLFSSPAAPVEVFQLFEAAFRALRAGPRLQVVVDDLQWVDPTSVALLHYLIRAAETTACPLTVLAAGRPSGAVQRLAESLGSVIADPDRLLSIDVGPLDRAEGTELARTIAPDLAEPDAVAIWERACGSPFWIETLVRSRGDEEPGRLPGFRLGSGPDASALLEVLAVAGRPLDRPAVAGIAEWPPDRVGRAADELVDTGLATDTGGALAVAHDLVREMVTDRLLPERRRWVHQRLARWLEQSATDDGGLLEAVEHGRRGGLLTLGAALRLAVSPRRRLLGSDALELLRGLASDDAGRTPDGVALDRATARLAAELGRHETALAAWSAISRRAATPSLAAEAALAAADCALHLGRAAESERLLAQAERCAGADAQAGVGIDAGAASVLLWLRHRSEEGQERALRAVHGARALAVRAGGTAALSASDRQVYLRAFLAAAEAAIHADRPAAVVEFAEELACVATAEDNQVRVRALAEASLALRWMGRNDDAEARLRLAWAEVRAEALPQATMEVGVLLAKILYSRGRLAEAADVLAECRRIGQRLAEYCPSRAFSPVIAQLLEASRGNWRSATEELAAAADAETDPHYRAHVRLERALLAARYDPHRQTSAVRTDVDLALADSAASGCRRCVLEVRARSAEALARIGDPAAGRALLDSWDPDPDTGNRMLLWWGAQARAAVLTAEGEFGSAARAWTDTVAEAERCGLVIEALWARIDLGAVLVETDRAAAAAVLREAGRDAGARGAVTEQQAVERVLRGLGVRTWRRTAGNATPELTAREREIAERVAAGANNREIAAAMFLSRKTVERHVSNILAKSGLRNRAGLAAAWSAAGAAGPDPEGVHR